MGIVEEPKTRILVVDDEPNITDLVSTALRYEGFDVEVAADGRTALSRGQTFRPELMVLDVMLPDLDGFSVVRRLRSDNVPVSVVFLTARDATEDKVTGLTLGGGELDGLGAPPHLPGVLVQLQVGESEPAVVL